jgi:CheY-like chemotaxis protein/CBS domain-containing protein
MLKAKDIMMADVVTLDPDDTVDHALLLLVKHTASGLPVVNKTGNLTGFLSEFDLLELISDHSAEKDRVRDYMSADMQEVEEEADWIAVADVFRYSHLQQVLVTRDEKFAGIISCHDMMRFIQRDRKQTEEVSPEVVATDVKLACRILVVEDGRANARFLSHVLKGAGAEVIIAENGQAALERYQASMPQAENPGDEKPFDVVLMDMQMPVMDGCEATKCLREEGYDGKIIAVTARDEEYDLQKCIEAGCDDYATKPIDRDTLLRLIVENTQAEESMAV